MSIVPKDYKTHGEFYSAVSKYYGTIKHNTYEEALEEALVEGLKFIK